MKVLNTVFIIGLALLSVSTYGDNIFLLREPSPEVVKGKYHSVIQDRGELKKAITDSKGRFLFSNKGAGAKPLVLIGSCADIVKYFENNSSRIINNSIAELPDILMGVDYYVPKDRFDGLFPFEDSVKEIVNSSSRLNPVGDSITDLAGGIGDIGANSKALKNSHSSRKVNKNLIYLKFGYLPEKGMTKIGSGELKFSTLLPLVKKSLIRSGICHAK